LEHFKTLISTNPLVSLLAEWLWVALARPWLLFKYDRKCCFRTGRVIRTGARNPLGGNYGAFRREGAPGWRTRSSGGQSLSDPEGYGHECDVQACDMQ
jgi:hypothetical protein